MRNAPEAALGQLMQGPVKNIDLGCVNGEYFAETLSFGLDALVAADTTKRRKAGTTQQGTSMILVAVSGYHEKDASDEKPAEAAADAVEAEPTPTAPFTVLSTVTGKVISLAETSEKVFASGMLGEGVGIIPEASVFVSPVTGTVNVVQKNGHAEVNTPEVGRPSTPMVMPPTKQPASMRGYTRL